MQHLPSILKIVEGGIQRDPVKVSRYVTLLSEKLELEGDGASADLLRKAAGRLEPKAIHAARQSTPRPPVDSESRMALADTSWPRLEDINLVFSPETTHELDSYVQSHLRRDELLKAGLRAPGHLLLFGPPGCGKSQTARYVAAALALPLVTARVDALVSSYLGSTAKNIRMLFDYVDQTPCVLFLDEFDAIAKMRDDPHELGELKRVVNSLLQNIDALPEGVAVVAATNHPQLLDAAVWRRFEFHVRLGPLADKERRTLLEACLRGDKPDSAIQSALSLLADGLTPAQIHRAVERSARRAFLSGANAPSMSDVAGSLASSLRESEGEMKNPWPRSTNEQIRYLRDLSDSVFTYDVISQIVGVSKGKISGVLSGKATDGR